MTFRFRYLIFLLLCVSPYACSSRYLSLHNGETTNEVRLNGKNFLKQDEIPEKTVIVQKHRRPQSIFEELQLEDIQMDEMQVEKSAEKTQIKGPKMQARSIMESKNEDDTEENMKSDENEGIVEDVVVMDYAQPHRKPPIHNLEP